MNPADDRCNSQRSNDVATSRSFSGTTTGPNSGELVTTNENAEHVGATSDHGQEHDAELARIVAAWDELPAVLQAAMLAIVDSAGAASRQ